MPSLGTPSGNIRTDSMRFSGGSPQTHTQNHKWDVLLLNEPRGRALIQKVLIQSVSYSGGLRT